MRYVSITLATASVLGAIAMVGTVARPAMAAKQPNATGTYVPIGVSAQGAWLQDSTNHAVVLCTVLKSDGQTPSQIGCIKAALP